MFTADTLMNRNHSKASFHGRFGSPETLPSLRSAISTEPTTPLCGFCFCADVVNISGSRGDQYQKAGWLMM